MTDISDGETLAPRVEPHGDLPPHLKQSVRATSALHADHFRSASNIQRFVDRIIRFAGRPLFAGVLLILIVAWIAINLLQFRSSGYAFDPPPFQVLQDAIGILALFLTVLILVTQQRKNQLDERRARLTLELTLLAEQKNAKIIAMLELLLREHPDIKSPVDPEASAMAVPADSATILSAIDSTQDDDEY